MSLIQEQHPDIAVSLANLAGIYESQGRDSEAEPLLMQALEIFERGLGLNHQYTAGCRKNLADLRVGEARRRHRPISEQ
ncbi:tetratricopeptide repeat protein [Nostoc sp. MG11]|uniref:tetratricopeptide repeat protein n=1 Tax=Nostoc sp. MG11 TaxID=2721166 RepID=UPI0018684CB3|nr:tetratricopeptide repeat protein [Nostoc sp. MG11]